MEVVQVCNGRKWMLHLAAAVALVGMTAPGWGATSECATARKIYTENCAVCHMANGKGKTVLATPDFTDPKWQAAHKDSELIDSIANGVKLTNMPPWKGQIAPAEIDALVKCVIRGFGKSPSSASHTPEKK
jgi:mono/diheme cytochrome c family protein